MKTGDSRAFTFWAPGLQQQTSSKRRHLLGLQQHGLHLGVPCCAEGLEGELVDTLAHVLHVEVAVDLRGDGRVRVAQDALHGGQGNACLQRQRGGGVPQVMEAQLARQGPGPQLHATEQIRHYADGLLPEVLEEEEGKDETRRTLSMLRGPRPEVVCCADVQAEVKTVGEWLKALLAEGVPPEQIALFGRSDGVLDRRAVRALELAGLKGRQLTDESTFEAGAVNLGTMHRAKGLEFRAVAVLGCERTQLPLESVLRELKDPADQESFREQERHLLYVAVTRARERLLVTCAGNPSSFLAQDDQLRPGADV